MQSVSKKTSWKATFWAGGKRCIQSGKMLHCYIIRSRSSGATGKARLPTVDRLTGGTRRRLVPVERSGRLSGRLHTGTSGPRYGDALPWRTLNVSTAILYSIHSDPCNQWRGAPGISWLLGVAELQSAPGANSPHYSAAHVHQIFANYTSGIKSRN